MLLAVPAPVLLAEYRTALNRAGYRVALAADGIQCLRRIRDFEPDAIVLDVDLLWGGADGVMNALRDDPANSAVSVMVIGSRANRAALYRVARFAVNDFQSKPLSGHQLVRRIGDLLESEQSDQSENRNVQNHQ